MSPSELFFIYNTSSRNLDPPQRDVFGLPGKVLVMEGCRGSLCQKTPGTAPMSNTASSSWLRQTHCCPKLSPSTVLVVPL